MTGALVRQAEAGGQLLVDLQADRVRQRMAGTVALVGELDRRLQHRAARAIHIELAARKPAEVGRIGGIEQQQRRLAALRVQIQHHAARLFLERNSNPAWRAMFSMNSGRAPAAEACSAPAFKTCIRCLF